MSNVFNQTSLPALSVKRKKRNAISLTALIDVVFILLMFFMLTTSFIKWQRIDINSSSAGSTQTDKDNKIQLIVVNADNTLTYYPDSENNNDVNTRHLEGVEQLISLINSENNSVLLPNEKTSIQKIVMLLSQLKEAGITQVTLGESLKDQPSEEKAL